MAIPTLGYVAACSYVVPLAAGITRLRYLDKALRVFLVLCVLSALQVGAQYVLGTMGIRNYFILNYFVAIEFILVIQVFSLSTHSPRARVVLSAGAILFLGYWLLDLVFWNDPTQISSTAAVVANILLIVGSLAVLHPALRDAATRLVERPIFWIAVGIALYSSGSLLVLGLSNELLKLGVEYFDIGWHINWALIILSNGLFAKAFLCRNQ